MSRSDTNLRLRLLACLLCGLLSGFAGVAAASPAVVIDVGSGEVLYQEQAAQTWYPASLTKLMTVYVALTAVRAHRISLDTPLIVSARAARMVPSKMGFTPGTQVTLDNALKMLMVKSANDIAISIAEGVSGSVEAFAEEMNAAAASLGLRQSHFVNPNGLHDEQHVSSARDMAILARALYLTFPEQGDLFAIGALRLGDNIIPTHNNLIGRYPGADGMKTGFTCAAGFNLVASAYRGGRRLVAVVLGAPSVMQRSVKSAVLFDRGFAGIDRPAGLIYNLASFGGAPRDMRNEVCRRRSKAVAQFKAELDQLAAPLASLTPDASPARSFLFDAAALSRPQPPVTTIATMPSPVFDPLPVYVGPAPGYVGPVAQARPPHSPVGTEPPPETASAYAAKPEGLDKLTVPIKPDVNALPMQGRGRTDKTLTKKTLVEKAPVEKHSAKTKAQLAGRPGAPDADAKQTSDPLAVPEKARDARKVAKKAVKENGSRSEADEKQIRTKLPTDVAAKAHVPADHSAKAAKTKQTNGEDKAE